jgi:magnesium chelatase subunit H
MLKLTSGANAIPIRVAVITLDSHLASACERARAVVAKDIPGLTFALHAASEFAANPDNLERCIDDIGKADIIVVCMLFIEDHINAVLPALQARREDCDAMVVCLSAPEITKLTRMGKLRMGETSGGIMGMLKKLRGKQSTVEQKTESGAKQMRTLRMLPKILRFIPGTAQDLRAYFLSLQYWLGGSDDNAANLMRMLISRYAAGPRSALRSLVSPGDPVEYPEVGVYHPRLAGRIGTDASLLPTHREPKGRVGVLVLRSYVLASNSAHYDGVIASLHAQGLDVVPAFASGLDGRAAIESYFMKSGHATVDAVVSLTGFSLVGGPAYNDSKAAQTMLAKLDVPYIAAMPVEFQPLEEWGPSPRGLLPVEATIMVAIPELDGGTGPIVFGGRGGGSETGCTGCERKCTFEGAAGSRNVHSCGERADLLAQRVMKLVMLRKSERASRKVAITIFNFPPNAGNVGTAAYLSVFESIFHLLGEMKAGGYQVEMPGSVDDLRNQILVGNAARFGANANVVARIPTTEHVRRERYLNEIEAQWGPAPGRQQADGASIHVLGAAFGNVMVGIQPGFGYEGDPMRLLFERGFAPTHAFSAYYRYIREDFGAHAVLHFGTHGALEFMPGKQVGMSATCWPDRLIGDLPNMYLYASNNPSEGAIAKRRAAATLVSYLTPPVTQAGLYKGLAELKASVDRWRGLQPDISGEREDLADLIQVQAARLELATADPQWLDPDSMILKLTEQMLELEYALIPYGLHVVGAPPSAEERAGLIASLAEAQHGLRLSPATAETIAKGQLMSALPDGMTPELLAELGRVNQLLLEPSEMPGLMAALDGRYIRPAPGGDLLRTTSILPTGRNLHGFDPFRIPSAFAVADGARQAERLLAKHVENGKSLPETIALVLWGTDNLKNEGGPIGQALALMGTRPHFDAYGRLNGAELIPLSEMLRPRIDVMMTLSGIFRDLLPLQIKLLADAAYLAACADEPLEMNFIRKHALDYQAKHGCDLETASLRVFSNADGTYGSNVNQLVQSSTFNDEDELAEAYSRRKCFAYSRKGTVEKKSELLQSVLADVELTYQNLDSVELGVTTVDQYFDTLGGISRAVRRARKEEVPVYIGDQTSGNGTVRTLQEQVALETRTRVLNPKWYEGMLKHGYEGVRQIEEHVQNTMGWSATTGAVAPWVYQQITELYVLDPAMRERLSTLNATASARLANRLLEAQQRNYWTPDPETLRALQEAGEELEDRLEGVVTPGKTPAITTGRAA